MTAGAGGEGRMTPQQREMARHALGLALFRKSYRNHYAMHASSEDFDSWCDLVDKGLADVEVLGGSDMRVFRLTRAGAEFALDPGERLDPEEFPTPPVRS